MFNWLTRLWKDPTDELIRNGGDWGQNENDMTDPYSSHYGRPKKRRLSEAVLDLANPDAGTEFDDRFFKSVEVAARLDIPPQMLEKAQRLSLLLYRKNVRADNAIDLVTDFVLGSGAVVKASDPKVQAVLDEHWEVNEWADKSAERLRSLAIFGEQLYAASVREDGIVELTTISSFRIREILRDPDDAEKLIGVKTGVSGGAGVIQHGQDKEVREFRLVRPGVKFDPEIDHAFYFPVNRVSGATRGAPDLFSAIDWLEGLDGFVFSLLERADISQDVVFDLEFEGLTGPELELESKRFRTSLRSGGVWTHNDKAKLSIVSPNLGSSDAETAVRILLKQIQAGTGLSGMFYGDAEDLTRASASELTVPVAKKIEQRQALFRRMLEKILNFQIDRAIEAGRLEGVTDRRFVIDLQPVFLRDLNTVATALESLGRSLQLAVGEGWIDSEQAAQTFRKASLQLGIGERPQTEIEESAPTADEDEASEAMGAAWEKVLLGRNNGDGDGNGKVDGADRPGGADRAGLRTGPEAPEKA